MATRHTGHPVGADSAGADTNFNDALFDAMYDEHVDEFYGHSDFFNFGYWTSATKSQREACENLIGRLLDFIPEKSGKIVDVACGKGATTRFIREHCTAGDVYGINLSERQLESSRKNAPGCTFLRMDAVALDFDDAFFDTVICVEAAWLFNTRERFFRESNRVLKPGGRLVVADILTGYGRNPTSSPRDYAKALEDSGFVDVEVVDTSVECLIRHRRELRQFTLQKAASIPRLWQENRQRLLSYHMWLLSLKGYVLACGRKPAERS